MLTWLKQLLGIDRTPELFSLTVDHHAQIEGRGKLVFGTVAAGKVSLGDTLFAHTAAGVFPVVVIAVESEGLLLKAGASEGQEIALLLRGKLLQGNMLHHVQQGDLLSHSEATSEPLPSDQQCSLRQCRPFNPPNKTESNMAEGQYLQTILVLPVRSIEESSDWYHKTLGFETRYLHHGDHAGEPTNYAIMQRDTALVHFILDEQERTWAKAGTGYLYLIVSDVDAVFDEVQASGAKIDRGLQTENWGARGFNLTDPSGNAIHIEQST